MRIVEDRYARDMRRHDLALRLIRHEVRTHTIHVWTGLAEERIRNLYRSYCMGTAAAGAPRHRGPAPHRLESILQSPALRSEAAAIAGVCQALGVLPAQSTAQAATEAPSLSRGERLCDAFELYRLLVPDSQLSLEQVMLLTTALTAREEVMLGHCTSCDAAILIEPLRRQRLLCAHCRREPQESRQRSSIGGVREREDAVASGETSSEPGTGVQQSLF